MGCSRSAGCIGRYVTRNCDCLQWPFSELSLQRLHSTTNLGLSKTLEMNCRVLIRTCCESYTGSPILYGLFISNHSCSFDTYSKPTNNQVLAVTIAQFLPLRFLHWMVHSAPIAKFKHLRYIVKISNDMARRLVAEKSAALLQGEGSRDVMSICVKANAAEDPRARLAEHEMLAQLR